MFNSTMSLSLTLSRCLTMARMLLPCAATRMRWPVRIAGASVLCQNGRNLVTVSFRHSVCLPGLVAALVRQVHVGPAGEAVLAVPIAFTVTDEHQLEHA